MARGENPGDIISIDTTLTYSETADNGHANAGKDLALSFVQTGSNAGKAHLAADGAAIIGKFLDLDKDGKASVMITGVPLIFRRTNATLPAGSRIVGGGNGLIKAAGSDDDGRGIVSHIIETGENGRVLVVFP